MPSRWKTFQPNEILPAADVNDCLNPSTADHIPTAMAAGVVAVASQTNAVVSQTVTVKFPPGRFTAAPIVTAAIDSAVLAAKAVNIFSRTSSQFTMRLTFSDPTPSVFNTPVAWTAVQM